MVYIHSDAFGIFISDSKTSENEMFESHDRNAIYKKVQVFGGSGSGKSRFISYNVRSISPNDVFDDDRINDSIKMKVKFVMHERRLFVDVNGEYVDILIFVYSIDDLIQGKYEFQEYIDKYINAHKRDEIEQIIFINNKIDLLGNYDSDTVEMHESKCKEFFDDNGLKCYDVSFIRDINGVYNIYKDMARNVYRDTYPIATLQNEPMKSNRFWNIFYDILTVLISFADLATDLWILYQYYVNERIPFFIIGLIIIIIAQLAYCFVFVQSFTPYNWTITRKACIFIKILPFSWMLAVLMYLAEEKEWFSHTMNQLFGLAHQKFVKNTTESDRYNWFKEKLNKHIGFILESVLEAFPQSILQMIAIVIYKETNIIAIISILLSMISVSTKALIFSKSIDTGIFLWNWLCACAVKLYLDIYLLLNIEAFINKY